MSTWPPQRQRDGGVDRIPLPGTSASLWLCGKHAIGPDHEAVVTATGATTVVCLVEPHEIAERYPDYLAWLRAHDGADVLWFPIPDLHAPHPDAVVRLLDEVLSRIRGGEDVVIHCAAGFGRTGTLAACVMVLLGVDADEAVATIRRHRPMAGPEVGAQVDLLAAIACRASAH